MSNDDEIAMTEADARERDAPAAHDAGQHAQERRLRRYRNLRSLRAQS
jgi:hypothetical protein